MGASTLWWLGLVFLVGGVGSFLWSLQGSILASSPPTTPILTSELSQDRLTGPLNEALVDGYLHLDQMSFVLFPRKVAILNRESTVVPLTGPDWVTGEPIKAFMLIDWLSRNSTNSDIVKALEHERLPAGSTGRIHVQKLMAEADFYSFDGDKVQVMRQNGLNVAEGGLILQNIENDRNKKLLHHFEGPFYLGWTMMILGLVMGLIGYTARRSLRRV